MARSSFMRLTVLCFFLASTALVACLDLAWAGTTGKVLGRGTDGRTNEALPGVNVILVGTNRGASTDGQGEFFITNINPGVYSLRLTLVGYKDALANNIRVRIDATTEVSFAMEETT